MSDSKDADDAAAACRKMEFQSLLTKAADSDFVVEFWTNERCIFVEGVASPADYMAMVFRNNYRFGKGETGIPQVSTDRQRFDIWLPFDLWSIVAAFVAPTRPAAGVTIAAKKAVHTRLADQFQQINVVDSRHEFAGKTNAWLYSQTLHHTSAIIELDKAVCRTFRADLQLQHNDYKAALADYNYELFHRDPAPAPKDAEPLYRKRSDALFGLKDINGAIDSRTNAVRLSGSLATIDDDMATIDRWRELVSKPKS
jgi:hypothetical protein